MAMQHGHELKRDGGATLVHGAIPVTQAAGVIVLRAANPRRRRIQLFNATDAGTGSTVYVGDEVDYQGNDLDETNGWPLSEEVIYETAGDIVPIFKLPASVLELFTKDAIYGMAAGADAEVRFIEEDD